MNRRGFLNTLLAGSVAIAIDPERLLYVPGQKTIFIPNPLMERWTNISGWAITDIPEGNYGLIQVTGTVSDVGLGKPKLFRYVRAKSNIHRNSFVSSRDVEWQYSFML